LADTVGVALPEQISVALQALIPQFPSIEFGVHLHSTAKNRREKFHAALHAGCKRFDGALKGIGGCPLAQDELVGNMDSLFMLDELKKEDKYINTIQKDALENALQIAGEIFV